MTDSPWALIYLRKSRDKLERADPDLLHKHRRELLRLAGARGQAVPPERIFEEQGSGDLLRTRPACRAALELIARRPRDAGGYLWTTEVARLTRGSLADRAQVYEPLHRAGVIHCTRDRDYDLRKAGDLYYWETETAQARRELGVYRERVDAAWLDMALEGRIPTGKTPYGWEWDRNHKNPDGSRGLPVPVPSRFPVVQALCRDVLHLSTYQLADKYGLPQAVIYNLLTNPFIAGWPHRRHFPHNGERRRRDNGEPWLYSSHRLGRDRWIKPERPGDHEPACTWAEWEAIQRVLAERRKTRAHTDAPDGWCRDVVRFVGHERHARLSAKGDPPWHRLTYELSAPGSSRIYIARDLVHAAASAALIGLFADPGRLGAGLDVYRAGLRESPAPPPDAAAEEARTLERRLDTLLERELDAAERRDAEDLASVHRLRDECKRRLAALRAQAVALAAHHAPDDGIEAFAAWLPQITEAFAAGAWERLDGAARRLVVRGLVEEIRCRVERAPGERLWRREVEEVRLKELWRK